MSKLGIGLIGCGSMGRSLGKALQGVEAARLLGVTDVDTAAAQALAGDLGTAAFGSAGEMIQNPECGAVIIATPGFQHRPLAEQAAAAGKHLFIEKPLAPTTADCDAIITAAESAGVLLMVGQVLRFYATWAHVIGLVRQGRIGTPIGVTVTRIGGRFSGVWDRSWRNSLAMSGGLLMEVNAHEIDFMRQVCGEVERVYAEADHYLEDDPSDFPNLYFVSMRFAGGAVGLLHSSNISAVGDLSGKVQGTEGTILYSNGFGGGGEIRCARHGEEAEVTPISSLEVEPPVQHELRLFTEAVLQGKPSPISGAEGKANVAVAEAAYESARTGQPVRLLPR